MYYYVNTDYVTKTDILNFATNSVVSMLFKIGVLMILAFWLISKFLNDEE